jgi:hypothetical protein
MQMLGDFELIRELGRGGMGIVYEARQMSFNRKFFRTALSPCRLASSTSNPLNIPAFLSPQHLSITTMLQFWCKEKRTLIDFQTRPPQPLFRPPEMEPSMAPPTAAALRIGVRCTNRAA